MAGGFTNFLENKVLEHLFITPYTPGTLFVGLCSADPGETATGAYCHELAAIGAYERVETAPGDWELAGTPGILYNKEDIEFPEPIADWGFVTHFAILDSGVYGAGNVLVYGPLAITVEVLAYEIPRFSSYSMSLFLE